jgi:hypothetical protein
LAGCGAGYGQACIISENITCTRQELREALGYYGQVPPGAFASILSDVLQVNPAIDKEPHFLPSEQLIACIGFLLYRELRNQEQARGSGWVTSVLKLLFRKGCQDFAAILRIVGNSEDGLPISPHWLYIGDWRYVSWDSPEGRSRMYSVETGERTLATWPELSIAININRLWYSFRQRLNEYRNSTAVRKAAEEVAASKAALDESGVFCDNAANNTVG